MDSNTKNYNSYPRTISGLFFHALDRAPDRILFRYREDGHWRSLSIEKFNLSVARVSYALKTLGVLLGDAVAISMQNRLEWYVSDIAISNIGAISSGIDTRLPSKNWINLIENLSAKVLIVDSIDYVHRISNSMQLFPDLIAVILVGARVSNISSVYCINWEDLIALGDEDYRLNKEYYRDFALNIKDTNFHANVHTSGTAGSISWYRIKHHQTVNALEELFRSYDFSSNESTIIKSTPCHTYSRFVFYNILFNGMSATLLQNNDNIIDICAKFKPTILFGLWASEVEELFKLLEQKLWKEFNIFYKLVARFFIQNSFEENKSIFHVNSNIFLANYVSKSFFVPTAKSLLGGRLRSLIYTGGCLSEKLEHMMSSIGISSYQVYLSTEWGGFLAMNTLSNKKYYTSGKALPSVLIKIDNDEIVIHSDSRLVQLEKSNFLNQMDKNTNDISNEGADSIIDDDIAKDDKYYLKRDWRYTGDLGFIDSEGYLQIWCRKSDQLITKSNRKIYPNIIEFRFKKYDMISHVMVGYRDGFGLCAWIALEQFTNYFGFTNKTDKINSNTLKKYISSVIKQVNQSSMSYEQIECFCILESQFSITGGELSLSGVINRQNVIAKYGNNPVEFLL